MSDKTSDGREGPFTGSKCLAGIGNIWSAATVRRVNEDNTFTIELDDKEMTVMPYWYGVTPAEVSFNDQEKWPAVFDHLRGDETGMTVAVFERMLLLVDLDPGEEWITQNWAKILADLFDVDAAGAAEAVLDVDRSYQLVRFAGFSAKEFVERLDPEKSPQKFYKLYWNQTRMGGREPGEIGRPVTQEDAFLALGLADKGIDPERVNQIETFEREEEVHLPEVLRTLLSREGVAKAVLDAHPNSPELLPQDGYDLELRRGIRDEGLEGDYAVMFMIPHQGIHYWVVAFDENELDGRVYVISRGDGKDQWALTASSIWMFFWDLAQTGLTWYQETQFKGGKPVRKSDIGLVLVSDSES